MPSLNKVEAHVFNKVLELYNNCCAACGSPLDLERDHVQPRSKGGNDGSDNLQVLCHHCNKKKNGTPNLPRFEPRKPEWDVKQIMINRARFYDFIDECRGRG